MKKFAFFVAVLVATCFAGNVPHVESLSTVEPYYNQVVEIYGSNFGTSVDEVQVVLNNESLKVLSVTDTKIAFVFPRLYGKSVAGFPLWVIVNGKLAEEVSQVYPLESVENAFMRFDDPSNPWTCDNAILTYDNEVRLMNRGYSLNVEGSGYMVLKSPLFRTMDLDAVSSSVAFYVWVPEKQVNPYWFGDVQLLLDVPEAGLRNVLIGQESLTGKNPGWNSIVMNVSEDVQKILLEDYVNARFVIVLNANQNEENYRIDQITFFGIGSKNQGDHSEGTAILNINYSSTLSFDNIDRWSASTGELISVQNKIEGLGATGVNVSGYTEVTSESISLDAIGSVTNNFAYYLYVPEMNSNDYWYGSAEVSVSCPADGIFNKLLGTTNLDFLKRGEFNKIEYDVSRDLVAMLQEGQGSCQFKVTFNVGNGSGMFVLDNMGFYSPVNENYQWAAVKTLDRETIGIKTNTDAVVDVYIASADGNVAKWVRNVEICPPFTSVNWNGYDVPSGRYLVSIQMKGQTVGAYAVLK